MEKEHSAGAIVFRIEGGRRVYLLLHYDAGHWDFIKGKKGSGESDMQTILREAKEESGLADLEFREGFKEMIHYSYPRERESIPKEVVFFLAETKSRDVMLSHEHQGSEWLGYEKARERLTFDNAKKILDKANEFLVDE
ncbi:MAG: NUDIX domain-containing protein [Candidatus Micrarchaeota archaeon]